MDDRGAVRSGDGKEFSAGVLQRIIFWAVVNAGDVRRYLDFEKFQPKTCSNREGRRGRRSGGRSLWRRRCKVVTGVDEGGVGEAVERQVVEYGLIRGEGHGKASGSNGAVDEGSRHGRGDGRDLDVGTA